MLNNSLLVINRSVFVRQNAEWEDLLTRLLNEIKDRRKEEALWHQGFRNLLDN
ncbi:hypothetical protein [Alkaliphilus sp. B6464]|uniref:hypothetical protein n=1 Tax=Alkaliphilus sp. B6464 TaxID=2731219 RepID=UPI001BAB6788|nr:hypothetical protein [Alkaliphilus sp. B6464]QUH21920.1 hypothetical protein HYG84_18465 [Alkaliphilus sp. B6464]